MAVWLHTCANCVTFIARVQALDTFNTAVVSPIYYVMFTSLTILASVIMFKVIIWQMRNFKNTVDLGGSLYFYGIINSANQLYLFCVSLLLDIDIGCLLIPNLYYVAQHFKFVLWVYRTGIGRMQHRL